VSSVEAFDSPLAGAVGEVADQTVQWLRAAGRAPTVAWQSPAAWPRVDIAVAYAGVDETALQAFVAAGARGIVHAGLGNANTPSSYRALLQSLPAQGVLVARCARFITGSVTRTRPLRRRCPWHLDGGPLAAPQGARGHAAGTGAWHGRPRHSGLDGPDFAGRLSSGVQRARWLQYKTAPLRLAMTMRPTNPAL